jgi:hypothetical protein
MTSINHDLSMAHQGWQGRKPASARVPYSWASVKPVKFSGADVKAAPGRLGGTGSPGPANPAARDREAAGPGPAQLACASRGG